ncbi:hypothetical protein CPB85DRAFT_1257673 [Mucidula mucida]|nr:hypothetical protein CPB85DRAFT_1257673 [Mucidula mucida]
MSYASLVEKLNNLATNISPQIAALQEDEDLGANGSPKTAVSKFRMLIDGQSASTGGLAVPMASRKRPWTSYEQVLDRGILSPGYHINGRGVLPEAFNGRRGVGLGVTSDALLESGMLGVRGCRIFEELWRAHHLKIMRKQKTRSWHVLIVFEWGRESDEVVGTEPQYLEVRCLAARSEAQNLCLYQVYICPRTTLSQGFQMRMLKYTLFTLPPYVLCNLMRLKGRVEELNNLRSGRRGLQLIGSL